MTKDVYHIICFSETIFSLESIVSLGLYIVTLSEHNWHKYSLVPSVNSCENWSLRRSFANKFAFGCPICFVYSLDQGLLETIQTVKFRTGIVGTLQKTMLELSACLAWLPEVRQPFGWRNSTRQS